jgi:hypothetical protein
VPTRLIGVNIMRIIGIRQRSGAVLARDPPHDPVGGGGVYVYENAHTALEIDPPPPPLLKNATCHKILKILGVENGWQGTEETHFD